MMADTSAALQPSDLVEKADSEYECELMIEALKKELSAVRVRDNVSKLHQASSTYLPLIHNLICVQNQLAFLTHHLDGETCPQRDQSCPASREGGSDSMSSTVCMKSTGIASTSIGGELSPASHSRMQATGQRNKKVWLNYLTSI